MTTTVQPTASTPPPVREEEIRTRQLQVMKRRATGLLVVTSVLFVLATLVGDESGAWGYVRTGLEASMVGGLADWFAVTAIFRHPLGIPIPHTAVIPERKDQFGQTLGTFVQENFLSSEVISERIRSSHLAERAATWLADPVNAETVARHGADLVVALAEVVRDEDVHRVLEEEVERAVAALDVAPLAGRALRMMTAQDRHQELLDALLRGIDRILEDNREVLHERFGESSPWWLPDAVDDRIFDRLYDGVRDLLHDVNSDQNHELRGQFDERVEDLIKRLEASPEMRERGEQLKREFLAHPELRQWTSSLWTDIKKTLRTQADDPESELRLRLADAVGTVGQRLHDDPALLAKVQELAESAVRYVAEHFHDEIAQMVSGTVARWDAEETSRKLELLLGRDLQFIRINGTVVGGLAGLAIHAIAQAIG